MSFKRKLIENVRNFYNDEKIHDVIFERVWSN